MRSTLVLVCLLIAAACGSEPVTVSFDEATNGVARFTVVNRTERDVKSISFELSFQGQDGAVVNVDTVAYESTTDASTGKPVAFVEARGETFFPTAMPSGSVSASGSVLEISFFDEAE